MTDNAWSEVDEALAKLGLEITGPRERGRHMAELSREPIIAEIIRIEVEAAVRRSLPDESWCDCGPRDNPVRGIEAGRHLPSCRYGIVLDYLDIRDPRAKERP